MPSNCTKDKIKEYNDLAYKKAKDSKIECNVCYKKYNLFTKSNHMNSKYHKIAVEMTQYKLELKQKNDEINRLKEIN